MTVGLGFDRVTRSFGPIAALEAFDLDCPAGAMTGLLGPNGAGKSTALALAAGLLPPSSGGVAIDGRPVRVATAPESLGYLPQRSAFHRLLRARDILELSVALRGCDEEQRRQALFVTGLDDVLDRPAGQLSGGSQRRLGLLTALVGSPRVLLLDEPFAGLDPQTLDRLVAHLRDRLASNAVVVIASHEFEILDQFGARLAILNEGRLLRNAGSTGGSAR